MSKTTPKARVLARISDAHMVRIPGGCAIRATLPTGDIETLGEGAGPTQAWADAAACLERDPGTAPGPTHTPSVGPTHRPSEPVKPASEPDAYALAAAGIAQAAQALPRPEATRGHRLPYMVATAPVAPTLSKGFASLADLAKPSPSDMAWAEETWAGIRFLETAPIKLPPTSSLADIAHALAGVVPQAARRALAFWPDPRRLPPTLAGAALALAGRIYGRRLGDTEARAYLNAVRSACEGMA